MNIKKNINKNKINNGINEIIYGNPSKDNYKVILLGDAGIGSKTSFINRIFSNKFDLLSQSTTGCSYSTKRINLNNGKQLMINFWDTPGQRVYKELTRFYLKDIDCAILGYDITLKESFENIKTFWMELLKESSVVDLIYLVGNKIDRYEESQVSSEKLHEYCEENNIRYFEISCATSSGIEELLDDLINQLIKK